MVVDVITGIDLLRVKYVKRRGLVLFGGIYPTLRFFATLQNDRNKSLSISLFQREKLFG